MAILLAESRFKHCAENRRADFVPAELFAGIERADSVGRVADKAIEFGKGNFLAEEAAVDVRKIFQVVVNIAAHIFGSVEHVEKILQGSIALIVAEFFQVVEKLIGVEEVRVAGIKTKYQPRTNFIEVVLVVGNFVALIIFGEGVANFADDFESFLRNFFFGRRIISSRVD